MLRLGTDVREVDVSDGGQTHEADCLAFLLRYDDLLPLEPIYPVGTGASDRNPRLPLPFGIAALAVSHGVEHDVGKLVVVARGGPSE